jgi:hypothetical protein
MAKLWDEVVDGRPRLDPDLTRTGDQGLIARVMNYLNGGALVLRAPALLDDHLDAVRKDRVPMVFLTDGEWIWSGEHRYYLQHYGILPESDFLRQMEDHDYVAPAVTQAAQRQALEVLTAE